MRSVLFAVLVIAGCSSNTVGGGGPVPSGGGPGGGDGGGGGIGGCQQDSDCNGTSGSDAGSGNGEVCARDGQCVPASEVQTVHTVWTVGGQPASTATCANNADLEIDFSSTTGFGYGYAPVPCVEGEFTVDKIETYYDYVQLGPDGDSEAGSGAAIPNAPSTGGAVTVSLDLPS
jgi:hypothetical protein